MYHIVWNFDDNHEVTTVDTIEEVKTFLSENSNPDLLIIAIVKGEKLDTINPEEKK